MLFVFISRKQSLGQGNIFTGVCLSTGGVADTSLGRPPMQTTLGQTCPPGATMHTPPEQPRMPPGSTYACPPGSNRAHPPGATMHAPPEQPCTPPSPCEQNDKQV